MAFNEGIEYNGPVEANDPGTPNNANSFYLQFGSGLTDRPAAGNLGVQYWDRLNNRLYFDDGTTWRELAFSHSSLSGRGRNDHHNEVHSFQSHTGTISANLIEGAGGFITGQALWYFGNNTPSGFLECDGGVVSRSTYSDLFNVIGTTYNTGGESGSQFRLPNLQRRVMMGRGGRRPSGSLGPGTGVGNTGGEESTAAFVGSHNHSVNSINIGSHNHSGNASVNVPNHSHSFSANVGSHTHNVSTSNHTHSVSLSNHNHGFSLSSHNHTASISLSVPSHNHDYDDLIRQVTSRSVGWSAFPAGTNISVSGVRTTHFSYNLPSGLVSTSQTTENGGGASGSQSITTDGAGAASNARTGNAGSGNANTNSRGGQSNLRTTSVSGGSVSGNTGSGGGASGSSTINTNNTSVSVPSHNTNSQGTNSRVNNVQPSLVIRCLIKT